MDHAKKNWWEILWKKTRYFPPFLPGREGVGRGRGGGKHRNKSKNRTLVRILVWAAVCGMDGMWNWDVGKRNGRGEKAKILWSGGKEMDDGFILSSLFLTMPSFPNFFFLISFLPTLIFVPCYSPGSKFLLLPPSFSPAPPPQHPISFFPATIPPLSLFSKAKNKARSHQR